MHRRAETFDQTPGQNHAGQIGLEQQAASQFLHDGHQLDAAAAETAHLLAEGRAEQTELRELAPDVAVEALGTLKRLQARLEAEALADQPGNGIAEHRLLLAEGETHASDLPRHRPRIALATMVFWISLEPP